MSTKGKPETPPIPPGVYEKHGWVLVVELGYGSTKTMLVPPGNERARAEALAAIEEAVSTAAGGPGCRTVTIAVHVQGAGCDHEVRFP